MVDLWSTWCKPCLATMPLLSRVQSRHKDDVTVIGMNIWEMTPKRVPAYVASRGDSMAFTVAMDSIPPGKEANEGLTALAYVGNAISVSIPKTILIDRQGRVAWVGNPADLEKPLSQVIDGSWDLESFARTYAAQLKVEQRFQTLLASVTGAVDAGDWKAAYEASEATAAADSSFAPRIAHQGFALIAMAVLRLKAPGPDVASIAHRAAERCLKLEPAPAWSDYLLAARAARAAGDLEAARQHLGQAISGATEKDREALQAELDSLGRGK